MRPRQIRRQCEGIIRSLPIPSPFDVVRFVDDLASTRERRIELRPMEMPAEGPSGMWIATGRCDYILYESRTTALHQEHIILHEVGHLLADHDGASLLSEDTAQLLLPNLSSQVVNRVLHRTVYSVTEERMAETIASMILEEANRWKPVSDWEGPADAADHRQRVHLTFDPSHDARRRQ